NLSTDSKIIGKGTLAEAKLGHTLSVAEVKGFCDLPPQRSGGPWPHSVKSVRLIGEIGALSFFASEGPLQSPSARSPATVCVPLPRAARRRPHAPLLLKICSKLKIHRWARDHPC